MYLQLKDSVKIATLQRKIDALKGRVPRPLAFGYPEIISLMKRIKYVENTSWFEPLPGYKMSFRSAGHIPGAAMFLIVCPDGTKVVHACDISLDEQALVRGAGIPKDFPNPDILVVECTYGNREIRERAEEKEEVKLLLRISLQPSQIPLFPSREQDL